MDELRPLTAARRGQRRFFGVARRHVLGEERRLAGEQVATNRGHFAREGEADVRRGLTRRVERSGDFPTLPLGVPVEEKRRQ